jgi:hypothetical protein
MNELEVKIETVTCPYCEQLITGSPMWLMAHGIACRQQWEIRQIKIEQNDKDRKN